MTLDPFLIRTWQGSIDVTALLRAAPIPEDSIVIVTGSLVEGHGNPFSDIDIICLTNSRPTLRTARVQDPLLVQFGAGLDIIRTSLMGEECRSATDDQDRVIVAIHDYADIWGTRYDIEFVTPETIPGVIKQVSASFQMLGQTFGSTPLSIRFVDARLLDRLLVGTPINGRSQYDALIHTIPGVELCYCLYRAAFVEYAGFQDVIGAMLGRRWPMAVQLARGFVLRNVRAWLHLYGVANPNEKWVTVYLDKIESIEPSIRQAIRSVIMPDHIEDPEKFALRCLDTAETLMQDCLRLLRSEQGYHSPDRILSNIKSRMSAVGRTDPHLRLSMEYYAKAGSSTAMALRDFLKKPEGLTKNCFD